MKLIIFLVFLIIIICVLGFLGSLSEKDGFVSYSEEFTQEFDDLAEVDYGEGRVDYFFHQKDGGYWQTFSEIRSNDSETSSYINMYYFDHVTGRSHNFDSVLLSEVSIVRDVELGQKNRVLIAICAVATVRYATMEIHLHKDDRIYDFYSNDKPGF